MKASAVAKAPMMPLSIEDSLYYPYAQEALNAITRRFPLGAFNQVENAHNLGLKEKDILHGIKSYTAFINELGGARRTSILAEKTESLVYGNCELFVNYAIGLLRGKYPSSSELFECMYVGSHTILVIGRPSSSSPVNIQTWGNAIICDLWSKQIYSSSHFYEKQRNEPPIAYYNRLARANPETGQEMYSICEGRNHYLAGNPEIETHPANRDINQACTEWVKEDSRRREVRVGSVNHSIFQADPNALNAQNKKQVLDSLCLLSGMGPWKANVRLGQIWLEGITDSEAEQVLVTLRLTGAMTNITQSRTAIDNKSIVICTGVSCSMIIEQADSLAVAKEGLKV